MLGGVRVGLFLTLWVNLCCFYFFFPFLNFLYVKHFVLHFNV